MALIIFSNASGLKGLRKTLVSGGRLRSGDLVWIRLGSEAQTMTGIALRSRSDLTDSSSVQPISCVSRLVSAYSKTRRTVI